MAIDGDVAVIGAGAYFDALEAGPGAAYVFERVTGSDAGGPDQWGQIAKLTASDGGAHDWFGFSVAISGDIAVVGPPLHDHPSDREGAVYVYRRDAGGPDNWGEVKALVAPDDDAIDAGSISVRGLADGRGRAPVHRVSSRPPYGKIRWADQPPPAAAV